jgi:hypothetical protein
MVSYVSALLPVLSLALLLLLYWRLRRRVERLEEDIESQEERIRGLLKVEYEWVRNLSLVTDQYIQERRDIVDEIQQVSIDFEEDPLGDLFHKHTMITGSVDTLLRYAEQYPELKEDDSFNQFSREVLAKGEEVDEAFDRYRETVEWYNAMISAPPYSFLPGRREEKETI